MGGNVMNARQKAKKYKQEIDRLKGMPVKTKIISIVDWQHLRYSFNLPISSNMPEEWIKMEIYNKIRCDLTDDLMKKMKVDVKITKRLYEAYVSANAELFVWFPDNSQ
jgi:hypothetical protein